MIPMTPLIPPSQIDEYRGCDPSIENCGPPEMCKMVDVSQSGECTTMIIDPCTGFDFLFCELPDMLEDGGVYLPREIEYEAKKGIGPVDFKIQGKIVPCEVVEFLCG